MNAGGLVAPDLAVAECANVIWKKARRGEYSREEALLAATAIERADFEIAPTRHLLAAATEIAIRLDHPAYDCIYLALARDRGLQLATADDRLLRRLAGVGEPQLGALAVSLADAAATARK